MALPSVQTCAQEALGKLQILNELNYGWTGQQPSSDFFDLAPSILHYNWF
jgi:hypothetical protein